MKTSKSKEGLSESEQPWPEERIDIVGLNGNDGLHYEVVQPYQDDFEQAPDAAWLKKGTVKELIEVLSKANPEAIVTVGFPLNKVVFGDREVQLL